MAGVPEERESPAAAAPSAAAILVVLEGEDEVNLADAVAEEQLGVDLGAAILGVLEMR